MVLKATELEEINPERAQENCRSTGASTGNGLTSEKERNPTDCHNRKIRRKYFKKWSVESNEADRLKREE